MPIPGRFVESLNPEDPVRLEVNFSSFEHCALRWRLASSASLSIRILLNGKAIGRESSSRRVRG